MSAHKAGWLNRDIRLCNIILVPSWPLSVAVGVRAEPSQAEQLSEEADLSSMVAGGRGSTWTAATSMAEGAGQWNGYLFCRGLLDRLGHGHPVDRWPHPL